MRRAYSYVRFSKGEQAHGDSLRRQLAGTQAYCDRKGLLLDDGLILHDCGVSAFRGKNAEVGALAAFLEAVRTGRVPKGSVLVIESLDRLSRSEIDDAFELFRWLLKAGIDITTLTPEREYTKANVKDVTGLLEPLFIMARAHEESATKSARLRAAWQAKRERMGQERATPLCPAWLQPAPDGKGFVQIPEAVATVRRIYQLAKEGFGAIQVATQLNSEGVRHFGGKKDYWSASYVSSILKSRAVCGEFQPHAIRDGKRAPEGKPIPAYFPAIMSEAEWYAARRAVELRRKQRGRSGPQISNLFTGLLIDARNGGSMRVKTKSKDRCRPYIVPSKAVNGQGDSRWTYFPYDLLERQFLRLLDDRLTTELLRKESAGQERELARLTGKLIELDRRIQAAQRRYDEEPDFDACLDLLRRLDRQKRAASAELEQLRQAQANNHAETLGEARSIIAIIEKCPPGELKDLRTRLKARIRSLVEAVWVLVEGDRKAKLATVQVFFRNGRWFRFGILHPAPVGSVFGIGGLIEGLSPQEDLRQWQRLEEDHRQRGTLDQMPVFTPTHMQGAVLGLAGRGLLDKIARISSDPPPP
jgi:DNA invertase Pin-like site-specific DNA recombinase